MSILNRIVENKKEELEKTRLQVPFEQLLEQVPQGSPVSLSDTLTQDSIPIIAEIKFRSPSRGTFPCELSHTEIARIYVETGAAAISVLTEKNYFGGKLSYLQDICQEHPNLPLLRKDFIIDRYQVLEARAAEASAYLLIVACLDRSHLVELLRAGEEFGIEPLVEVHDPYELETAIENGATLIGVNNRNLVTFDVDLDASFNIARRMEGESGFTLIAESGIHEHQQILELRDAGFSGFLIGSAMMNSQNPGAVLNKLLTGEEADHPAPPA
jgi:indole-3-glycerol phosphate synthase